MATYYQRSARACAVKASAVKKKKKEKKKILINDAHLSLPWLSKCKQRTQLLACDVISQR